MLNTTQPQTLALRIVDYSVVRALSFALCVLLFAFVFAPPAEAQEIPDWAAPAQEERAVRDQRGLPDSGDEMGGPPPFPTPLDPAGLALLAAAGGVLAARRLRHAS